MSDWNVKICRIIEYKIKKILGILFRKLHLILLKLTLQPWKLLTYGFATLRLVGSQVETSRVVNLQPVGLLQCNRLVTLHLLACSLVILSANILTLERLGFSKEVFFWRGQLDVTVIMSQYSYPWVNYTKLVFTAAMLKTLQNEICPSAMLTKIQLN